MKQKIRDLFKSLRFSILAMVVLACGIPGFAIKETLLHRYENRTVQLRIAELQNQCTILNNQLSVADYLKNPVSEVIGAELTQLSNVYSGRIMIIDSEFRIQKDTFGAETGKTIVSADVIRCFTGTPTSQYNSRERYIEITLPIMSKADKTPYVEGVMLVSTSTDTLRGMLEELESKADMFFWMLMCLAVTIGVFLAAAASRPFDRIARSIGEITEGYENENIQVDTYAETRRISDAFNRFSSRMKTIDESRQEFVSNVSHELRTPLTSMKVLADSLLAQQDAPIELYKEFMGDVAEEIERESNIINDLLSLVKMDRTSQGLDVRPENINELVERILKQLRPVAALQNIELVFESFRPVIADVDEVKLSLAISNLVENAIKYNRKDGWVKVSLNADHKYFYLKVEDSGIGIPADSLDHIFERFYRVDKSHSREISGTGLGLAIARSAVVTHRGSIKVYSEEGTGTTFTVRIPLTYIA